MQYDLSQLGLRSCLQLFYTKGLGALTFGRLLEAFGSAENALQQQYSAWRQLGITEKIYQAAQKPLSSKHIKSIETWLTQASNHHIISYDCHHYPASLKELADPPAILFAVGDLTALTLPTIAIIGSRQATPLGLKTTQKFAYELASFGLSICSGLALGIDGNAHLGALSAQGTTVAFMGTGVDVIYPKSNTQIAQKMIENKGLLVSALPLGTSPKGSNFPPRNRLICGLSTHGVIVIESKSKGGSMITARLANEQGRDVFAVPGSIQSPLSEGCHILIQQGAKLVQNTQDILDELNLAQDFYQKNSNNVVSNIIENASISADQQKILTAMNYEILRIEDITEYTSFSLHTLTSALLELELQGKIKALSGNRWQRIS